MMHRVPSWDSSEDEWIHEHRDHIERIFRLRTQRMSTSEAARRHIFCRVRCLRRRSILQKPCTIRSSCMYCAYCRRKHTLQKRSFLKKCISIFQRRKSLFSCVFMYATLQTVSLVATVLLIITSIFVFRDISSHHEYDILVPRLLFMFISPLVLGKLLPIDFCVRSLIVPLVWIVGIQFLDILCIYRSTRKDKKDTIFKISLDPQSVSGLTLGLASFLGSGSDNTHRTLFLYAIVGCVVVSVISHNFNPGTTEYEVFSLLRSLVVTWSIGLVISGVCCFEYRRLQSNSILVPSRP